LNPARLRTLVVVTHPSPTSLTRAALSKVVEGLERAGADYRVIDLDQLDFDPRLTAAEAINHFGSPADRPYLGDHLESLAWAERLVLVYPTWFSAQPARLKGWFDRVWMHQVAFELPPGSNRIRGRLRGLRRIEVFTTMGSSRTVNWIQGNGGRLRINRTLRVLCHPRCRVRWTVLHKVDNRSREDITRWLDSIPSRLTG
jgi:putative NADPH-quinone reductase